MNNILILGSEGFIGKTLVQHFLHQQYSVYGCDLYETVDSGYHYFKVSRLSPEWEEIFTTYKFTYCVNASGSGNVPYSMTHPFTDFEANTLDTIRVLDVIRRHNRDCKYLHISSAAVYGNPDVLPVSENACRKPLSPYGWHKLMAEHVCQEYFELYNVQTTVVRPFSVYGNGLRKQLLWDICSKLRVANSITLFGTGKESRDFIQVKDLCQLVELILQRDKFAFEVFNAASGKETFIKEIANIFEDRYKGNKSIKFNGESRSGDPVNWRADITKATSIGFHATTPLEEGIMNYINWFESLR